MSLMDLPFWGNDILVDYRKISVKMTISALVRNSRQGCAYLIMYPISSMLVAMTSVSMNSALALAACTA